MTDDTRAIDAEIILDKAALENVSQRQHNFLLTHPRRTTSGPDFGGMMRTLMGRISDLESQRSNLLTNAATQGGSTSIGAGVITDANVLSHALTGASLSLGLALGGSLSTAYGFVNNSTGLFVTTPSTFSFNSTVTDPDVGVNRDAKFGQLGIAVLGGTKTDTLNVTGASTFGGTLTITSLATFGPTTNTIAAATTFSAGVTFSSSSLTFTGRPFTGTNTAFDTITGGAGAGVGNIAASTIQGYNVLDNSLPYAKLTGAAQSQITALTVQDTPFSFLRRVSATGSSLDSNGNETDGMTINNSATRVTDSAAYAGTSIQNAGMSGTVQTAVSGPAYTGLRPGQYAAVFYLRLVSGTTAGTVCTLTVSGTAVSGAATVTITQAMLSSTYTGFTVPFTVTAVTNSVNCVVTNAIAGATDTWAFSHVLTSPSPGVVAPGAVDSFLANASITDAKINTLTAAKLTAGLITSDNITLGTGGHIYAGTSATSPTGNTARIELNAAGLYGYNGTQNTFALTNTGLTLTGVINATGGTITGSLTVTGTLSGGNITGATISGASITGTTSLSGATVTGGTIVAPLIETSVTSTASRTILDSSYGMYVNRIAGTNGLLNPGAEYPINASGASYPQPTGWLTGGGTSMSPTITVPPNCQGWQVPTSQAYAPPLPSSRYCCYFNYTMNRGTGGMSNVAAGATTIVQNTAIAGGAVKVGSYVYNDSAGETTPFKRVIGVSGTGPWTLTLDSAWSVAHSGGFITGDADVRIPCQSLSAGGNVTITINVSASVAGYIDATACYLYSGGSYYPCTTYVSRYTAVGPDSWTTLTWTTPAITGGTSYLVVSGLRTNTGVKVTTQGQGVFIDNCQLEIGTSATDYIDGDQGEAYAWTGSPGVSSSTRALLKTVDHPHIGTHQLRGAVKVDSLIFPTSRSQLVPDSVGAVLSTVGGLDLNGRGIQTTMLTSSTTLVGAGVTLTNPISWYSLAVAGVTVSLYAGRLYRITLNTLGFQPSVAGRYYFRLCQDTSNSVEVPTYYPIDAVVTSRQGAGTYMWYYSPSTTVNNVQFSTFLYSTVATGSTVVYGNDWLEVADLGIQR